MWLSLCGRMRQRSLEGHHPGTYTSLLLTGKLWKHLAELDAACNERIWIGICGAPGADPTLPETFLTIGTDELSVSRSAVLPPRAEIRKSVVKACTVSYWAYGAARTACCAVFAERAPAWVVYLDDPAAFTV